MREILYDADWQMLRINCLAARSPDGGWGTLIGTKGNLEMFYRYWYEHHLHPKGIEQQVRCYRMNNCLNAVHMGYRGQGADNHLIRQVVEWRHAYVPAMLSWRIEALQAEGSKWNWNRQVEKLRLWNGEDLDFLLRDLRKRAQNGSDRTRPELHKFIGCIKLAQGS